MKLLRTLLSLDVEDRKQNKPVAIFGNKQRSAHQLQRHKPLLSPKSAPSSLKAYSSINLNNINKYCSNETESEENGEIHIQLDLETARNSQINLTLITDTDLMKFKEMTLESDYSIPYLPLLTPHEYTSSIQSITSSFRSNTALSESSLSALKPTYTVSDLNDTKEYEYLDEVHSIGDDVELDSFPLSDFKYMYKIGSGAFGTVDKAFHLKSCSIVAIKQCRSCDICAQKCFKKEIKICTEFAENKYIISMMEYGISCGFYIALEYMNMSSLNTNRDILLHNNALLMHRIKHICFCVLNGLSALHSQLYVHNDIKPHNILFNDCGDVKICDFGCCKRMKDINSALNTHCGTEFYQSFEKRFVSPIVYDTKSDIYSFGITICELLVDDMHTFKQNTSIPFKFPIEIMRKYQESNPQLILFLNKCLKRDPNERLNAKQLLNDPFLAKYEDISSSQPPIQDIDDLEFMINALIDYYSISKHKDMDDDVWSDEERMRNIARFSGCTVNKVRQEIAHRVKCQRDKYLRL